MVRAQIELIEDTLELLPDTPTIYQESKRLVVQHGVMGAKVHDARLVAAMAMHGIADRSASVNALTSQCDSGPASNPIRQ